MKISRTFIGKSLTQLLILAPLASCYGCVGTQPFATGPVGGADLTATVRVERVSSFGGAASGIYVVDDGVDLPGERNRCDSCGLTPNGWYFLDAKGISNFRAPDGFTYAWTPAASEPSLARYGDPIKKLLGDGNYRPVCVIGKVGSGGALEWKRKPGAVHLRFINENFGGMYAEGHSVVQSGETRVFKCEFSLSPWGIAVTESK